MSFGLVNVPVKLVTATSPKDVRFHQLHDADLARINQKRVCSLDGEEVDYAHIVKGYDLGGGRYVVIEPEELRTIDPEASRTIDIEEFVDLVEIDPIYFEHSYYLVPDERAAKPYALLVEAMAKTGKVALGRFVLRTKQYLAALRAKDSVLVLSTMLYPDEVIDTGELDVPDGRGDQAERPGAAHGRATGGVALRRVRRRPLPRRAPGAGARPDRAEVGGSGDRRGARAGGRRSGRRSDGRPRGQPGRGPQGQG